MKVLVMLVLVAGSWALAGCGHELFVDANNGNGNVSDRRISTYYDDDSAVKTRESRRKASEMGFGYPSGMSQQ